MYTQVFIQSTMLVLDRLLHLCFPSVCSLWVVYQPLQCFTVRASAGERAEVSPRCCANIVWASFPHVLLAMAFASAPSFLQACLLVGTNDFNL